MTSPQITGLECARPGMFVFQTRFSAFSAFQFWAAGCPSTTPEAPGPRNWGQFCAGAEKHESNRHPRKNVSRFISLVLAAWPNEFVWRLRSSAKRTAEDLLVKR